MSWLHSPAALRALLLRFARIASGILVALSLLGCSSMRIWWGDVHGHSAWSDGKGTADQFFVYARDAANLDFAILTDHDFGNGAPWRLSAKAWTEMKATAVRQSRPGRFVAIAGYEWTSQAKYWKAFHEPGHPSEQLLDGTVRFYNHKNVYYPTGTGSLYSSKDAATMSPDLLATAVRREGGLIHNNHPTPGKAGRDQWDYAPTQEDVICNTEIMADRIRYKGKIHRTDMESLVREALDRGKKMGFVGGSDTHEGQCSARTAVLARELSAPALFDALRRRHCYAVYGARIELGFSIGSAIMGDETKSLSPPLLKIHVRGTAPIQELAIIKNGAVLFTVHPDRSAIDLNYRDGKFTADAYYYIRVTQADSDEQGNPSRAWSSPIWVQHP